MTDLLLRVGVSNFCLSAALAIVAWAVQAGGKRPHLAHFLWLLVVAKLVTPPLLTIPVIPRRIPRGPMDDRVKMKPVTPRRRAR